MNGSIKIGVLVIALMIGTVLVFKIIGKDNIEEVSSNEPHSIEKSQLKLEKLVPAGNCVYGIDRWSKVYFICAGKAERVFISEESK